MKRTVTALAAAIPAAAVLLAPAAAHASAPTPFPVHVITSGTLTTAHDVTRDERLVIAGHDQVTVVSVTRQGAVYGVHVKGTALSSLQGRTVPAIPEG